MRFIPIAALIFFLYISEKKAESASYQPFSTSVIEISFSQMPTDTVYLAAMTVNNIPNKRQQSEKISVVETGKYYLSLTNDRPAYALLAVAEKKYKVILLPDDTISIDVVDDGSNIAFRGKGADINQYYQNKQSTLGYSDTRTPINQFLSSSATYVKMKNAIDSIIGHESTFLEKYVLDNHLPQWFINYEKAEINYCGLGFKTGLPSINSDLNYFQDSLPNDYYNFLDDVLVDNPSAVSSYFYLLFLDDYFMRGLPSEDFKNLGKLEKLNVIDVHILNQSETQLSDEVKKIYHSYLYSKLSGLITNSGDVDSLMQKYGVKKYEKLLNLNKLQIANASTLSPGDTIPNFYVVDPQDSLLSIRDFQDKILYINLWATWCKPCIKNFPALNSMIDEYAANENIAVLNICIKSDKEDWLEMVSKYGLKGVNLFAEGRWNKKLQETFSMQGVPNYVLIREGNVLYENHTSRAPVAKESIDQLLFEMASLNR